MALRAVMPCTVYASIYAVAVLPVPGWDGVPSSLFARFCRLN